WGIPLTYTYAILAGANGNYRIDTDAVYSINPRVGKALLGDKIIAIDEAIKEIARYTKQLVSKDLAVVSLANKQQSPWPINNRPPHRLPIRRPATQGRYQMGGTGSQGRKKPPAPQRRLALQITHASRAQSLQSRQNLDRAPLAKLSQPRNRVRCNALHRL